MLRPLCVVLVLAIATNTNAEEELTTLWAGSGSVPVAADLETLDDVEFHVIKKWEPDVDSYDWLHGVALAFHRGKLYASFGRNKGKENTASEEAHYCVSNDRGKSWSQIAIIDTGTESTDLAVSHGVFLTHNDRLWTFHGAFRGRMTGIHTRAYVLDESSGRWAKKGVVIGDGFWPMNGPVRMDNGNWIMSGLLAGPYSGTKTFPAAVAISNGDDFQSWKLVEIPARAGSHMWGESSLIVDGKHLINIARFGGEAIALAASSNDYGQTWTTSHETNLPMAGSKPAAGVLSNGCRYLICTTAAKNGHRRHPLTIAIGKPGESTLSKVYVIRPANFPEGPGESGKNIGMAYPYAIERDGKLYVGYSNNGGRGANRNSAELAIIPIERLTTD